MTSRIRTDRFQNGHSFRPRSCTHLPLTFLLAIPLFFCHKWPCAPYRIPPTVVSIGCNIHSTGPLQIRTTTLLSTRCFDGILNPAFHCLQRGSKSLHILETLEIHQNSISLSRVEVTQAVLSITAHGAVTSRYWPR